MPLLLHEEDEDDGGGREDAIFSAEDPDVSDFIRAHAMSSAPTAFFLGAG